jgi:hypothetical protein
MKYDIIIIIRDVEKGKCPLIETTGLGDRYLTEKEVEKL